MSNQEYTGGREMMVTDWFELTDIDRSRMRLQELREEKFLRETDDFKDGAKKAMKAFLIAGLCLVASFLLILAAIIYSNAGV